MTDCISERSKMTRSAEQKGVAAMTVGLDLGDKYSFFCVLENDGEIRGRGPSKDHAACAGEVLRATGARSCCH